MKHMLPTYARLPERLATQALRLTMVVIFYWFGAQKFTAYEAMGIAPLISNSPITSWLTVFGTQGASMFVGSFELTFGTLLLIGLWRPSSFLALAGACGSTVTFLTTLSFLFTTPGVFAPNEAPVLSGTTGVFLIKDIVLLASSLVLLTHGLALRRYETSQHQGLTATAMPAAVLARPGA